MGLLDEVREAQRQNKIVRCKVVTLNLSKDDRAELEQALADETVQMSTLAKVLRSRGHVISDDALRRHKGRRCACANGS
jgi:NTP pyrophosphatase (non-canonical NTP hydrolase)